jgi:hypothetical protein
MPGTNGVRCITVATFALCRSQFCIAVRTFSCEGEQGELIWHFSSAALSLFAFSVSLFSFTYGRALAPKPVSDVSWETAIREQAMRQHLIHMHVHKHKTARAGILRAHTQHTTPYATYHTTVHAPTSFFLSFLCFLYNTLASQSSGQNKNKIYLYIIYSRQISRGVGIHSPIASLKGFSRCVVPIIPHPGFYPSSRDQCRNSKRGV